MSETKTTICSLAGKILFEAAVDTMVAALVLAIQQGADLYGANLEGANLEGADLRGANLEGADLEGADLEGANLYGANLEGANLYGANLEGADLRGANLEGANLYGADLEGANLYGADLRGADLEGANLYGANLYGANLMTDQRTKARLAVSEFQSASRAKLEAERDFTRAHDQLGKLLDDLIAESEGLRRLHYLENKAKDTTDSDIEEMVNLRRKLGLVTPAPQWPEPRPIAEAPKLECILAYVPTSSEPHLEGRWLLMAATEDKGKIDGFTVIGARPDADHWFPCSILQPTHFLPLPPAPEVRK